MLETCIVLSVLSIIISVFASHIALNEADSNELENLKVRSNINVMKVDLKIMEDSIDFLSKDMNNSNIYIKNLQESVININKIINLFTECKCCNKLILKSNSRQFLFGKRIETKDGVDFDFKAEFICDECCENQTKRVSKVKKEPVKNKNIRSKK